jgi:translation initiation factor 3 subunit G
MDTSWNDMGGAGDGLPAPQETGPDADGVKTVVFYKRNASGKVVRVTQRRRVETRTLRTNPAAEKRKRMPKFGLGLMDTGATTVDPNEVTIEKPALVDKDQTADILGQLKQMQKDGIPRKWNHKMLIEAEAEDGAGSAPSGVYRVPRRRDPSAPMPEEEIRKIRVSNLPREMTDDDLKALVRPFGSTEFVMIAKDRMTGESRGFAFVTYRMREDAEKALAGLAGHKYGSLVISTEWAKQRRQFDGPSGGGLSGMRVSGYGKALPQTRR